MRLLKKLAFLLLVPLSAQAATVKYNGSLVNESGLAVTKTVNIPMNQIQADQLSVQVSWSTPTVSGVTFTDGSASTFTVTVTSYTALSTATASDFLTIITTQAIPALSSISVNGVYLINGVHWYSDVTSSATTAISIKQAINTYVPNVTASTGVFAVVFTTAVQPGSYGNNMTLVSFTSSITVNSASFTGGKDATCVSINGVPLCANYQFQIGASSAATAVNISSAINNGSLNTILIATAPVACGLGNPCGVVLSTSSGVGPNSYVTSSSSQNALTISNYASSGPVTASGTMYGGTSSAYTINTGIISASNSYSLPNKTPMVALPVLYGQGVSAITNLTDKTTYYVIPVSSASFGLSTTSTGAVAGYNALPVVSTTNGTFIILASSQVKTTADSYTLTVSSYGATTTLVWNVSNDGVNYTALSSTGSVVMTPVFPNTSTASDFGTLNYSWVQAALTRTGASWSGPLQLLITINGKNSGL